MAVEVQRNADLAVSEPLAGDLGVNVARQQVSGVAVAQIMEPDTLPLWIIEINEIHKHKVIAGFCFLRTFVIAASLTLSGRSSA